MSIRISMVTDIFLDKQFFPIYNPGHFGEEKPSMSERAVTQNDRPLRLHKKRALITGGAGGIGRAIVNRFVAEGAAVVIADLHHAPGDDPKGCYKVIVDVADEMSVKAMTKETVNLLGGLDVLVNCAGTARHRDLLETELADWRRIMDINLTGTFLCNREAVRVMLGQKSGCIINIASVASVLPGPRTHTYAASKGGVVSFTKAIAGDLAPHGIRVNVLSPGTVDTDLLRTALSPEFRAGYIARLPMGRYGQPVEVAGAAVFLASDDASYITGIDLFVDGGFSSAGVRYKD
jgi:NAD(P)-dependent dehydrogenase (short-subunit alcohol dehydrogenase family)